MEGQLFRAHRNVLFASSGYFRMLLSQGANGLSESVSASFDVFSPETFSVILDFIYSGQLDLSSHNVIEVMSAASYLQMNNVISYCKNFIKSSLEISAKEGDSDRYFSLTETCSLPHGAGDETSEQQQGPCSVSPPPALWTHDGSRSQPGFLVRDPEQEAPAAGLKADPGSPTTPQPNTDVEELLDPGDPLFTLPTPERRRGKGAAKRRTPYCTRSSTQHEAPEIQEARTQKAEKAEELYSTLPTIVGVIGQFNRGELGKCVRTGVSVSGSV